MSQVKNLSWTSDGANKNLDVGFTVDQITITNRTAQAQFYWDSNMPDASYLRVDTGAYTASNGFTPLSQSAIYGASITGFTNANPGVITASNIAQVGIVAGDTIMVSAVADDGTGTSLNGEFTVASVTATTITLVENTSAPTYSVYVSGGKATRISDTNGDAVPTENYAIQGITLGSGVRGSSNDLITAVVTGSNSVT